LPGNLSTKLNEMKKTILVFGLIAGLIVTAMMLTSVAMIYNNQDFKGNEVIGYTTMLVAFSFIFVGIKQFRDKHNQGIITFGKAFRIGLYISLIASTMYVLVWLVEYYVFVPDFAEKYATCVLNKAKNNGATPDELARQATKMASFTAMYKNPVFVILISYMEILPIGLLVALISALLLKRKVKPQVHTS
jgi:uncharacterized protein with PQ loop repeat